MFKRIKTMTIGSELRKLDAEISIFKIKLEEEQAAHEKTKSQLKVYKYIVTSMPETLDEIKISRGLKKRILNKLQSMIVIK